MIILHLTKEMRDFFFYKHKNILTDPKLLNVVNDTAVTFTVSQFELLSDVFI